MRDRREAVYTRIKEENIQSIVQRTLSQIAFGFYYSLVFNQQSNERRGASQ